LLRRTLACLAVGRCTWISVRQTLNSAGVRNVLYFVQRVKPELLKFQIVILDKYQNYDNRGIFSICHLPFSKGLNTGLDATIRG